MGPVLSYHKETEEMESSSDTTDSEMDTTVIPARNPTVRFDVPQHSPGTPEAPFSQINDQDPLVGPVPPANKEDTMRPGASLKRKIVWTGEMEWQDKVKGRGADPAVTLTRRLNGNVSISKQELDLNVSNWPNKMTMQLIPQSVLSPLSELCKQSRMVAFNFSTTDQEALKHLYKVLASGFAGCIHFPPMTGRDVRVLMLLYHAKKRMFVGMIPENQQDFVNGIRQIITNFKNQLKNPGMPDAPVSQISGQDPQIGPVPPTNQADTLGPGASLERKIVWTGALEWKVTAGDQAADSTLQLTRSLVCNVSIFRGEPDLNAGKWPRNLTMQLLPLSLLIPLKQLWRQSRIVTFSFGNTDTKELKNLSKALAGGYAGCVHLPPIAKSDGRVLVLIYNKKKRTFVGMIPENQHDFVTGVRQEITNCRNQRT